MDESNMLDTGFLERLNTLLANGEVPGLFERDEHTTLMSQIKESTAKQGLMLDTPDELYKWFTTQVMRNLHVVFTMNPSENGLRDRASTSPALFNRCVLNWPGDWDDSRLVGSELAAGYDTMVTKWEAPFSFEPVSELVPKPPKYEDAVMNTMVLAHNAVKKFNLSESKRGHRTMAITPRHSLDCIRHYTRLYRDKYRELQEEKQHLNIGLDKIKETEKQVLELQKSLSQKSNELEEKKAEANKKLKQMLLDQQKVYSFLVAPEGFGGAEPEQAKQAEVQKDLSQVEPAVEEAKAAVSGIGKQQLIEVRSMASPPVLVKLTLEAIMVMLGGNVGTDWKGIRGVMVKEDFMNRIVHYKTDQVTPELIKAMQKYISNPDWEFEKASR
ncbi:unnamed protein product, partial [Mesorhabditis spiculigera]